MPLNEHADRCTATTRDGERCKNPAVEGWNVCRMHGAGGGAPTKTGLYSSKREQLQEKMKEADRLDDPGELWGEIAVLRALLSDFLEEVEEVDAETVDGATKLVSELRKTLNTISKVKTRNALTANELRFVQARIADMFKDYVPRGRRREAITELKQLTEADGRER